MTQVAQIRPLTTSFGAEVVGIDTCYPSPETCELLRSAVLDYGVVFLHGQALDDDEHLALAGHFGRLSMNPLLELTGQTSALEFIEDTAHDPPKADRWHTDITWLHAPPKFAFLSMRIAPDIGGDTMWADTQAAYETLPSDVQNNIRKLTVHRHVGEHFLNMFEQRFGPKVGAQFRTNYEPGANHPLVRRNDDTGRAALFLAGYWMDQVVGMPRDESDALLESLMSHATQPRFCVRWHWTVDDLVIWDERRTMHIALPDHYPRHRLVRRCTIQGDRPIGAPVSLRQQHPSRPASTRKQAIKGIVAAAPPDESGALPAALNRHLDDKSSLQVAAVKMLRNARASRPGDCFVP